MRQSQAYGSEGFAGRRRVWLQIIAASALALVLGAGHAPADTLTNTHDGGQSADKAHAQAIASAAAAEGQARAASVGGSDADAGMSGALNLGAIATDKNGVHIDIDMQRLGTQDWTRTITRSTTGPVLTSSTQSTSVALDDEGNRVVSVAVARARAPNDVAAVQAGAGSVYARTSVDVTGYGAGSASAGGSIGISDGGVKVSTWGRTSAEVF